MDCVWEPRVGLIILLRVNLHTLVHVGVYLRRYLSKKRSCLVVIIVSSCCQGLMGEELIKVTYTLRTLMQRNDL